MSQLTPQQLRKRIAKAGVVVEHHQSCVKTWRKPNDHKRIVWPNNWRHTYPDQNGKEIWQNSWHPEGERLLLVQIATLYDVNIA